MVWLVVASEYDEAARWAAEQLPGAGLEPLLVVTDVDLLDATWDHRLGSDGTSTRVTLVDGRTFDSVEVEGTLNRLIRVPVSLVAALPVGDRTFALQEVSALLVSWLASLPGPMLNPPEPRGLSGAWRPPAEWAMLVGEAGLQPAPLTVDSEVDMRITSRDWRAWSPYEPYEEDVIVVGDVVFAREDLPAPTIAACRRLGAITSTPLLGLCFADGTLSEVVGVTPLPDLRAGGHDVIDALAAGLRAGTSAA